MQITENKAYILGLFVGGGTITDNSFQIVFPLKKWGEDVKRMRLIAKEILSTMQSKFHDAYGFSINYQNPTNNWTIVPNNAFTSAGIKKDLSFLGLPTNGLLLNNCDLSVAKAKLKGVFSELFLTGIFDARASLTKSHRRFFEGAPTVSIEIPGSTENFKFVIQLCEWLTDMGSTTDQILFNHPCQHSSFNPLYKGWKKGFKVRFLIKSFLSNHSFAMQSKAKEAVELKNQQKAREQMPCRRRVPEAGFVSIHSEIDSDSLPEAVRSKIFLHYLHYCAVLGCKYAPSEAVAQMVTQNAFTRISPFPVLLKDKDGEKAALIYERFIKTEFPEAVITSKVFICDEVVELFPNGSYPEIESALAFLFSSRLRGNRHVGPKEDILKNSKKSKITVKWAEIHASSPLLLINESNERGAIVGSINSKRIATMMKHRIAVNNLEIKVL